MKNNKINSRLIFFTLISHICIFFLSIIFLSVVSIVNNNNYKYAVVFLIVLSLYFASGYLSTQIFTRWYNYYSVTFIGVILWLSAFAVSPNSLNYKSDNEAGVWMIYRFYIAGIESPLNYYDNLDFADRVSVRFEMFFIFLYPIIASTFQYLGGQFKMRKFGGNFS